MLQLLRQPAILAALLMTCASSASGETARANYLLNCMGCHLMDGGGTKDKVPALKGEVAKFLHVEGGREFLVQVPGTSQSRLNNRETADVLNYVLRAFDPDHMPQDFTPYTEDEVARHRGVQLVDAMARRAELAAEFVD